MESRAACQRSAVAGRVCSHTPSLHVQCWPRQRPGRAVAVAVAAGQEAGAQEAGSGSGSKPKKQSRNSHLRRQQSSLERRKARVSRTHEESQDNSSSSKPADAGPFHQYGNGSSRGSHQSPPPAQPSNSSSNSSTLPAAAAVPQSKPRAQQGTSAGAAGPAASQRYDQLTRRRGASAPGQQQQQQAHPSRVAASKPSSSFSQTSSTSTSSAAAGPSRAAQPSPPAAAAGRGGPRRIKQYAPVLKGDLQLPGGPHWSSLRRHISAAGADPSLPSLPHLIIVEGDQDQRAVARAVNAPVYVCDGTRVLRDHVRPELEALPRLGRTLVVLTDPDERGRELRNFLDETLGPEVLHAFIPEKVATSGADTASHEAGNRGIEHVVPRGVQLALQAARGSFPSDRCEFTAAELQERRLVNAWNAASSSSSSSSSSSAGVEAAGSEGEVEEGAALRRRRLCALLGLGRCQGNQLLDMLNRYVTRERFEEALAELAAGTGPAAASGAVAGAAAVQ